MACLYTRLNPLASLELIKPKPGCCSRCRLEMEITLSRIRRMEILLHERFQAIVRMSLPGLGHRGQPGFNGQGLPGQNQKFALPQTSFASPAPVRSGSIHLHDVDGTASKANYANKGFSFACGLLVAAKIVRFARVARDGWLSHHDQPFGSGDSPSPARFRCSGLGG
jgi:hypothetical protein